MDMEEQLNATVPTKVRPRRSSEPHMEDDNKTGVKASKRYLINNINIFIANIFFLNIARMALRTYLGGSIRTIERRFGLNSTASGIVLGLMDVLHIFLVLFIGFFGRTSHKPKLIGITSIFPAVTGFFMAMPYFLLANNEFPAPSPGVQAMVNETDVRPDLIVKMMEQQPRVDLREIATMMRQPGANLSYLSSIMGQPGTDPSQLAKMMGKLEANLC